MPNRRFTDQFLTLFALSALCLFYPLHVVHAQDLDTAGKQSLAQFVYDTAVNEGAEAAGQVLEQYKDSDKFYLKQEELLKTCYLLFQSGKEDEHATLTRAAAERFPKLKSSLANNLFELLVYRGTEQADMWMDHVSDKQYREEFEFELATSALLKSGRIEKALTMAETFLESFPKSLDAHQSLAEVQMEDGDKELALETWRKGNKLSSRTSFFSLAAKPLTAYKPTVIPDDPTKLFKASGNTESDIAFVFVQGGPDPDFGVYRQDPLTLLPNQDGIMRVNVYESQMLNPGVLAADPVMTDEQALFEHNQSAEILNRTVAHLKSLGKKVYVIGHSYGCMIGLEYLHSKPNLADKVILMGSDPDEDLRNYPPELKGTGRIIRWVDGIEPYEQSFFGRFALEPLMKDELNKIFENTDLLVSAHAKRRFTKLLKGKDLSNVTFAYGKFDESNGRPKPYELKFLQEHGATVVESYGDHHSMLSPTFLIGLYEHVTEGKPLKKSVASLLANKIEADGIDEALKWYREESSSEDVFPINETEINWLGYQLVKKKKLPEAIAIFKLNVESFPQSWNVHDSLGETLLANGDPDAAETSYRKSLELHPGNGFGIAALKKIKEDRIAKEN